MQPRDEIDRLAAGGMPDKAACAGLIRALSPELAAYAAQKALAVREAVYGRDVFVRGLVEISSFCKNDCYYCGLRRSNKSAERYRLRPEEILACADEGHALGFRTFVLQGGEDAFFTDGVLVPLIRELKRRHGDSAVTLSLGERGEESFRRLFEAGADRYLLRHETVNPAHYGILHPPEMSHKKRLEELCALRRIGYQTGSGFMVGSPGQTVEDLAGEIEFVAAFKPEMCGIGPFIPHSATPFADERPDAAQQLEMTCFLLSLIRLVHPRVLLPATTALGTIAPDGRERGLLAGANVVMPNLSPMAVRKKYMLYNGKLSTGAESAQALEELARRVEGLGFKIAVDRGDAR